MPNALARERSPYLLQHADNPVEWLPWGDEAFAKSRREDKPIFLSIGYSTCHWCHVMAHESFEDPAIAAVLNRDFVPVKLDREERPDVDRVYMLFVQATTGAGGWPMSVWLTPSLAPFFGGTYFPPSARWGRPGFIEVLQELARAWRDDRPRLLASAKDIVERLRDFSGAHADPAGLARSPIAGPEAIDAGVAAFTQNFDRRHGGFGGAPKFPRPSELQFLFHAYALRGDARARDMALTTLQAMAMGGMRDQIGGGFHRYSVDAEWRVPHFEKMLYDQAQLVLAYLDAFQISGEEFYASIAEDTMAYVVRELTSPDGALYSAEDADSVEHGEHAEHGGHGEDGGHGEKKEGAFYVWRASEIDALLKDDAPIVRRRFGIEDSGNALADPQGEFTGQNILYVAQSLEDIAARSGRKPDEIMQVLQQARLTLMEARAARPRPHLDDKVITAWNGLMIAAMARAARVLVDSPHRAHWREAAERAAEALFNHLRQPDGRLFRRFRDGEAAVDAFAEDYAAAVWGLLELFQATGAVRWLDWARDLTAIQTRLFFDDRDGGWFTTTGDDPSVLLRLKEDHDGAEPSPASVTVRNLLLLGQITGDAGYTERARRTLERYGSQIASVVRVMPFMVANVALWHAPKSEVVLVGDPTSEETRALERVLAGRYLPAAVAIPVAPGDRQREMGATLPWIGAMSSKDGRATAFVCQAFACQAPTSEPATLARQLEDVAAPRRIIV